MSGLMYVTALIYLLGMIILVWLGVRAVLRKDITRWKWGVPVLISASVFVFWDWVPTVVAHEYYCSNEGGYTQYKALDEWNKENPGVAETLHTQSLPEEYWVKDEWHDNRRTECHYRLPGGSQLIARYDIDGEFSIAEIKRTDGTSAFWLNQRFAYEPENRPRMLGIVELNQRIVDTKTGEVVARYVDFDTDVGALASKPNEYRSQKRWMEVVSCGDRGSNNEREGLIEYMLSLKMLGGSA